MKICIICEGSYPYIPGGVSGWVQMICEQFTEHEFHILAIATSKEEMYEYKYNIPKSVTDITTIYLADINYKEKHQKISMSSEEYEVFRSLILSDEFMTEFKSSMDFIKKYREQMMDLLMSEQFYVICLEKYNKDKSQKPFTNFVWNMRGMYLPFMYILSADIPEADVYHSVSTGYAGLIGSCASHIYDKPFILSEHGIYTREREEDIIRSEWVDGEFKDIWIDFFKKLSLIAYNQAGVVTSLFEVNKTLQEELGCDGDKIVIIPNGIDPAGFNKIKKHNKLNPDTFNAAAILRVVPIKDVKTMILAFDIVREQTDNARLYLMGNTEENKEYYTECVELIQQLGIEGVEFLGQVNIKEYLAEIDVLMITSISEGQPLAILEGMAAGIPFIATNVGDCKSLLKGNDNDDLGEAGIVVPVMDSTAIAEAIIFLMKNPEIRKNMGEAGRKRVNTYYRQDTFIDAYRELYRKAAGE